MPGAGLYEVGPGKPYATIQGALDQLWLDQGSSPFTATQEIRIYNGTYNEAIQLNSGLRPMFRFPLVFKAAPGNSNVVVTNAGLGNHTIRCEGVDNLLFEGFTVRNDVNGTWYYAIVGQGYSCRAQGMTFTTQGLTYPNNWTAFLNGCWTARDCLFADGTGRGPAVIDPRGLFERCRFSGHYIFWYGFEPVRFEACVFTNDANLIGTNSGEPQYPWPRELVVVRNCIFYNGRYGLWKWGGVSSISALVENCIFHTITRYVYWADTEATQIVARRNCYYNCAKIARVLGVDYTTLAEWQAVPQIDDGSYPDQDSFATDPKLADPANGDFSLAADSPCRRRGIGAGVPKGVNGVAFDRAHPDIGAWSSGEVIAPGRPAARILAVDGGRISVHIDGDDCVENVADLFLARTGECVASASRQGDGTVALDAPELSTRYVVAAWSRNAAGASPPAAPIGIFVPASEGPLEEVRAALVARLSEHPVLAELLGLDESGAVPIYASGGPAARRVPSLVYTLGGWPDASLDRPGRWTLKFLLEVRGGSTAANDLAVSAADEALHASPFDCVSWSVKRIARTGDETVLESEARTEVRRTVWSLVADRKGS